jgi:hypothetical protein
MRPSQSDIGLIASDTVPISEDGPARSSQSFPARSSQSGGRSGQSPSQSGAVASSQSIAPHPALPSSDSAPIVDRPSQCDDAESSQSPSTSLRTKRGIKNPPFLPSPQGEGSAGLLSAANDRTNQGPERVGMSRAFAETLARCRSYAGESAGMNDEQPKEHPDDPASLSADAKRWLEQPDPDDDPSVTGRPRRWGDLARYGFGAGQVT